MVPRHLALIGALCFAAGSFAPTSGAEPAAAPPWTATPTWLGGTARYDVGEWVYTDFVYDDYGADTTVGGQPNVVSLAPTSGDFRYPEGNAYRGNAADIVEVRARLAGDDLEIRVLLSTLVDPSVVALSVTVDATESVVTAATAAVDAGTNTVTFTVPDAGTRPAVTLGLGAGLHDGQGGLRAGVPGSAYQMPGEMTTGGPTSARLFDLAFNSRDIEPRGGAWNEQAQSRALADGDLSRFVQTIDVDALRRGDTTPIPTDPGYYVAVLESRQNLGEGMAESFPQYRSRWQPYALWIPTGYDPARPAPLLLSMHSLSYHHNQYRGGANATFATYYEQLGDVVGAIVVTPMARGPNGWYEDEALVDTLEVWADARRRFTIDPESVLAGGYSMGGYGTYRLTTLMPDAIASAAIWVGPPTNGVWAYPLPPDPSGRDDLPDNTYWQLESTRHIPTWITHGTNDELVPVTGVAHQAARYGELGHPYRFSLHPGQDHMSFAVADDWNREAAWLDAHRRRVTVPARVTLDIRPATWANDADPVVLAHLRDLTAEVGARLDGGYWVSGIQVADGDDVTAEIDLTSEGIARREAEGTAIDTAGTDGPSPYLLTGNDPRFEDRPVADRLTGTVSGATALTIDVGAAGLSDDPDITIESAESLAVTLVRNGTEVGRVRAGVAQDGSPPGQAPSGDDSGDSTPPASDDDDGEATADRGAGRLATTGARALAALLAAALAAIAGGATVRHAVESEPAPTSPD